MNSRKESQIHELLLTLLHILLIKIKHKGPSDFTPHLNIHKWILCIKKKKISNLSIIDFKISLIALIMRFI